MCTHNTGNICVCGLLLISLSHHRVSIILVKQQIPILQSVAVIKMYFTKIIE